MTLYCEQVFYRETGVRMDAVVELNCLGDFANSTTPSEDGMQIRVTCMGDLHMRTKVLTVLTHETSKFFVRYRCQNSFSSVTNQDLEVGGRIGTNFYQNAVCNGTEVTQMEFSSRGDLLSRLVQTGSFCMVHMGSCRDSATLLSSIDILGVFYSFIVIPKCEPDRSSQSTKLYHDEDVPISMSCNGDHLNITHEPCKGLLMGVAQKYSGTIACKCRGNWLPSGDTFTCTGELYGEQDWQGALGSYIRSSVCAGRNVFEPIFTKEAKGTGLSGSNSTCYGAAVKSTLFEPSPFQKRVSVQRRL